MLKFQTESPPRKGDRANNKYMEQALWRELPLILVGFVVNLVWIWMRFALLYIYKVSTDFHVGKQKTINNFTNFIKTTTYEKKNFA